MRATRVFGGAGGLVLRVEVGRALEGVVDGTVRDAAGVPGAQRLAGDVEQGHDLPGVGGGGDEGAAEEVVAGGGGDDAAWIGERADVAGGVEDAAGGQEAGGAVVGDGEERAAEGVGVGDRRRAGVREAGGGGALLGGRAGLHAGEPGRVGDGVAGVPRLLAPGVEDDLGVGAVGEVGADQAADRVVVEDRRHAPLDDGRLVLVVGGRREERLVLLDGVALVVEDGAAGADPARRAVRAGLGHHLGHRDPAGAVPVGVALEPAGVGGAVLLAGEGVDEGAACRRSASGGGRTRGGWSGRRACRPRRRRACP